MNTICLVSLRIKKEHIANVNIKFKSHICKAFWCKINGIPYIKQEFEFCKFDEFLCYITFVCI